MPLYGQGANRVRRVARWRRFADYASAGIYGAHGIAIDGKLQIAIAVVAMDLRAWRKSKKLTLQQVAPLLGLPVSSLSDLERGAVPNVSQKTLAQIWGMTAGAVTAADLFSTWTMSNPVIHSEHRAAGRSAMQAFRTAAKKPRKQRT